MLFVIFIGLLLSGLGLFDKGPKLVPGFDDAGLPPVLSGAERVRKERHNLVERIVRQWLIMRANYPIRATIHEDILIREYVENDRTIVVGHMTDSVELGRPSPRAKLFFAVGMILSPEAMAISNNPTGGSLTEAATIYHLDIGPRVVINDPWPSEPDDWEQTVAQLRAEMEMKDEGW